MVGLWRCACPHQEQDAAGGRAPLSLQVQMIKKVGQLKAPTLKNRCVVEGEPQEVRAGLGWVTIWTVCIYAWGSRC